MDGHQGDLFEDQDTDSFAVAFNKFHRENPNIYRILVRLARKAKRKGVKKMGIALLWEVMRWELLLEVSDDGSGYKLNNNHKSRYARIIMANEGDLEGVFETRQLTTN